MTESFKEPPWKYLAGIDTTNPKILKHYMTITCARLSGNLTQDMTPSSPDLPSAEETEAVIIKMFQEIRGSDLLEVLTFAWADHFDKSADQILQATERLKRDATFFVRRPKMYEVEYDLAQEAYESEGWVYLGKVVYWTEMPAREVARRKQSQMEQSNNEAKMDGRQHKPAKESTSVIENDYVASGGEEADELGEVMQDLSMGEASDEVVEADDDFRMTPNTAKAKKKRDFFEDEDYEDDGSDDKPKRKKRKTANGRKKVVAAPRKKRQYDKKPKDLMM